MSYKGISDKTDEGYENSIIGATVMNAIIFSCTYNRYN